VQAEAELNAPDQFQQGVNRERDAVRQQRAGRPDTATRGFWGAAELFDAARNESGDVAKAAKVAAAPEPPRPKAPDPKAASVATTPRLSAKELDERGHAEQPFVNQALHRYEAAYATLAVENVRRVYPSAPLDQLSKEFANSRSYVLTVEAKDFSFVFTDSLTAVTVTGRITHEVEPKSGTRITKVEEPRTIQLEKQGANWIIKYIR
jgi:hypothetical protein